jgi:acyl-CoA thioester hydrolase
VQHRVPFYETDAMGVVHHANYVKYLELARIAWLDEHATR